MVRDLCRFDIVLLRLNPSVGAEVRKTRPCLMVSPDEMNKHISTVIVAPMTSVVRAYPSRVPIRFNGRDGEVALDQLRTIDKSRVVRRVGKSSSATSAKVAAVLVEMFAWDNE